MITDPDCPVGQKRSNHSPTEPGCTCSPSRARRETREGPTLEDPTPRCDCGGVISARVHYPGRSLASCAVCALTAANVALAAGWPVTLEPALVPPQPPCQGCGTPIERCGPALWLQGKSCCPDCTHGAGQVPGPEYEPGQADVDRMNAILASKT